MKDTVSADEENDEVEANNGAEGPDAAVRLDTVVHHRVPVFARQYLYTSQHQSHTHTHTA